MKKNQDVSYLNFNVIYRTGGYFSPPIGTSWTHSGTHAFCQNKFYFVTDGTFSITINGKTYKAKPGDWFFIPAGIKHNYHNFPDKPMAKYWMHFDIFPANELMNDFNVNYHVKVKNTAEITNLFSEFSKICESYLFSDILKVKAIILNLISKYLSLAGKQKVISVRDAQNENLHEVLTFINNNYNKNLSTAILAKISHLHPTHFIRTFKNKMAQTPQQYIINIRMEHAKHLLLKSALSIAEIAERVGYDDPAHFSKLFKKFFSFSPLQYRKGL